MPASWWPATERIASGFAFVFAVQSASTDDHKFAEAVDYALTFSGTWL